MTCSEINQKKLENLQRRMIKEVLLDTTCDSVSLHIKTNQGVIE